MKTNKKIVSSGKIIMVVEGLVVNIGFYHSSAEETAIQRIASFFRFCV
jgi:hypothetical protein